MKLGEKIRWTQPNGIMVDAIIEGVRRSGTVIRNSDTGEEYPGVQFLVHVKGEKKKRWTLTFPDSRREFI